MQTFILDSSIIIKGLNAYEDNYETAKIIFEDIKNKKIEVLLPDYWKHEVLNYISRVYEAEKGFYLFKWLESLQFKEKKLDDNTIQKVIKIIKTCKGTASYDATFHAMAIIENATLITADEKHYNKT